MKILKIIFTVLIIFILSYKVSLSQSQPFIGQIVPFALNFEPNGWMKCDGRLLQISEYDALFALIGTTFGGDGQTTFALPDLRARFPMNQGTGSGLSQRSMGEMSGTETKTLSISEIPAHTHIVYISTAVGNSFSPSGNYISKGSGREKVYGSTNNATMHASTLANTGSNIAFEIMNPFLVVNYCIAVYGIFPQRN